MSILIKGMEMPSNCCQCPVNMEVCKMGYKYLLAHPELYDKRADDCPLVPVPPHGRLGDLDEVINDVRHYLCEDCSGYMGPDAKTESCDYCQVIKLIKMIERKSSIIPADKEDKA